MCECVYRFTTELYDFLRTRSIVNADFGIYPHSVLLGAIVQVKNDGIGRILWRCSFDSSRNGGRVLMDINAARIRNDLGIIVEKAQPCQFDSWHVKSNLVFVSLHFFFSLSLSLSIISRPPALSLFSLRFDLRLNDIVWHECYFENVIHLIWPQTRTSISFNITVGCF